MGVLSVFLATAAAVMAAASAHLRHVDSGLTPAAVPALLIALVAAACLQLRFSYQDHFEAIDLFDAVLAPAIYFLGGPIVVAVAAMAMALSEAILRTAPVKAAFNVCQWAAAAAAGSLWFSAFASGDRASTRNLVALAAAMAVVAVVNHGAMVSVFALVSRHDASFCSVHRLLSDTYWIVGGAVNLALGLLLVAAINTGAWAMALFAVPLAMLHRANRGFAEGRADRARLAGLQRATHALVGPIDPRDAIWNFLAEVRDCFDAEVVEVVLVESGEYRVQRLTGQDVADCQTFLLDTGNATLALALLEGGTAARVQGRDGDPALARLLRQGGWRDCLAAPLVTKGSVRGLLCAYNRAGLASFQAGELPVLEALATELAGAFEKAELVDEVLHQALHDALTGLPNRALFQQRLERAIAAGERMAVLLLDLNRFKEVNDTLGHHHGDLLLTDFSRRIEACIGPDDTVARLGGDEFGIALPGVAGEKDVLVALARLLEALNEPFALQDLRLDVDVAVGIALHPEHGTDPVTLLQRADVAMYEAKGAQRRFEVYAPERDPNTPRRLAVVAELRNAVGRGELVVHYQPKSEIRTARVIGVEALVRWRHPVHGFVPPDEFIPLAEQTGAIHSVTTFVLRETLSQCAAWRRNGVDLGVAVNLSVRSLLDPDLPGQVAALLAEFEVSSESLTLELTETSTLADPARTGEVLSRLHGLGLHLSIDDYGTGYSSLAHLRQLPVDEMKIDRSFVKAMHDDADADVIVRSTVDLGHNLGLWVVAEGVETERSWDRLHGLGCDAAQGWYIGRPVPAAEIERLVAPAVPRIP
ncbi:MAG TPA: EAL domain-containing protein [Dermatophilaceae bacterium]|nr:EAL domain-containing protein [Dermatophilaceae bacterium]